MGKSRVGALIVLVLIAWFLNGCTGGNAGPSPSPTASSAAIVSLEGTIKRFMDDGVTSVVVQVRWPGGEWSKAYGVRDGGTNEPARPEDRFSIGSVTKSMTAAAVMKLVDEGLIGLDDPVNGILESFNTPLKPPGPITVRQLLSHTSGMPEFLSVYEQSGTPKELITSGFSMQRGLEMTATLPWDPRNVGHFAYSNSNYLVLGQLLEKLREKAIGDVLRDDIFRPLGLDRSTLSAQDREAQDNLRTYVEVDGERVEVTQAEQLIGFPGGGVVSTAEDVNDFFRGLFTGGLISAPALKEMKTVESTNYALGLMRWRDTCSSSGYRYGHRGSVTGYLTNAVVSDDGDSQIVIAMALPTLPMKVGDPVTARKVDQYDSQMELAANKALDQLCA
ncbi:serine hydrolase domain-containing protein [Paenarthrobacter sp. NPDC090517]|uniref:serine hydrolase domain-containing protein n=1 Tax=Paenarthrobacter sp. NPDC090517 TaxID=3364381 RepID=UPI0038085341